MPAIEQRERKCLCPLRAVLESENDGAVFGCADSGVHMCSSRGTRSLVRHCSGCCPNDEVGWSAAAHQSEISIVAVGMALFKRQL